MRLASTARLLAPALDRSEKTLIHNDFNPRNIGLRNERERPRLVAYDWELATVGPPQRDLAEFLSSTLPEDVDSGTLHSSIERHRQLLEDASGGTLARRQ